MYQLINNGSLIQMSKLMVKFNFRTCSSQIYLIRNDNNRLQSNQLNCKSSVRHISLTSVNLLKEKPKFDETTNRDDKNDPILFGKVEEKESELKKFFKKYGRIGATVYILVSLSTIGIIYLLIELNVDVSKILSYFNLSDKAAEMIEKNQAGGKFAIAYCISKALIPFKLATSLLIIYFLKNVLKVRF